LASELTAHRDTAFPGNGKLSPEQQRIRELERQVQRLEMEKAILKKATVFFARAVWPVIRMCDVLDVSMPGGGVSQVN
jgi:transposase-like protein